MRQSLKNNFIMGTNDTPIFTLATPGIVVTQIGSRSDDYGSSVTVQADGKIVVAGNSIDPSSSDDSPNFAVVRYNSDGSLDTSFGTGGKLVTDIDSGSHDYGRSVIMQPDGKIVVAGYSSSDGFANFSVVRYNSDGSLDTSFGTGGKLVTDIGSLSHDYGRSVTMQPDGKIVVAGYSKSNSLSDFCVVRYNSDGSLDISFNGTGKLVTDIDNGSYDEGHSVTVQADGKIVVAGFSRNDAYIPSPTNFAVVRYNSDGSLDTSFNGMGKLVTDIDNGSYDEGHSVTVQANGKIVVAGYSSSDGFADFSVVRYNSDGSLDTSFGTGGKLDTDIGSNDHGYSVTVQADGKIVVAGVINRIGGSQDFAVVRHNTDGTLDTSFGAGGKLVTNIGSQSGGGARGVVVQADGKIVVAGESYHQDYFHIYGLYLKNGNANFTVARYNADGTLDTSFGAPAVHLLGDANNNTLYPTLGFTQSIDGGLGTDTVVIAAAKAQMAVQSNSSGGFSVQRISDGATLNLAQVERLTFTDGQVALDVKGDGHAGQAVKLLGALGGPQLLTNKTLVGDVIRMLDAGYTSQALAEMGLQAFGAQTPTQVVQLLWTNLTGRPASGQELQPLVAISQGTSGSQLALMASNLELNATRIGLTGLAETGIEFL